MSFEVCLSNAKEMAAQAGVRLSDDDFKRVAQVVHELGDGATMNEVASALAKRIDEIKTAVAREKARKLYDIYRVSEAHKMVIKRNVSATAKEKIANIKAFFDGGAVKNGYGVNVDPITLRADYEKRFQAFWQNGVGDDVKIAESGISDDGIYQTIHELENGIKPTSTDAAAVRIGKAAYATIQKVFELKQTMNPGLEKISDYFIKQYHNAEAIGQVDIKTWVDSAIETFGEKSFPGLSPEQKVEEFVKIYKKIVGGTYSSAKPDAGNLIARLTTERVLIPKDWKAAYKYNQKFGYGTFANTMQKVMSSSAYELAMIEKFGSNRDWFFESLKKLVMASADETEHRELDKAFRGKLRRSYETAIGMADAPPSSVVGRASEFMRQWTWISMGGGSAIRSMPDFAHSVALVSSTFGPEMAGNAQKIASVFAKGFASTEQRNKFLNSVGLFSHIYRSDLLSNFGMTRGEGMMHKMAEGMGVVSGLRRYIDSARAAIGTVVADHLGSKSHLEFDKLNSHMKAGLERYGIGKLEWELVRKSVQEFDIDGKRNLISMDTVDMLDHKAFDSYARETGLWNPYDPIPDNILKRVRLELANKVGAMINQHADIGTSTPGTSQKAFMYMGTDADSGLGAALRLMWQFKGAAVTTFDNYRRLYLSGQTLQGSMMLTGQTAAMSMFFWMLGDAALSLAKGEEPRNPVDPEYMALALVGSGAGSIGGDVLMRELTRDGQIKPENFVWGFMGPGAATSIRAGLLPLQYAKEAAGKGNFESENLEFAKLTTSNTPFLPSLPYTKGAWNFYFANAGKEFAKNGYLHNLEKNFRKDSGLVNENREYLWSPTDSPEWR